MEMKVLYYCVVIEGQSYYFSPDELDKAIDFADHYWLVQKACINNDRWLDFQYFNWSKWEFTD